jgi:hypothetical protein
MDSSLLTEINPLINSIINQTSPETTPMTPMKEVLQKSNYNNSINMPKTIKYD